MALLYQAELRPSKIELIEAWAPSQPWFDGSADGRFTSVGSFRFDDPDGEVGIETILVKVGDGPILQIPLTYRGAPLEGGEAWLIGTMEHSVLGRRWVYDATGDPAYLTAVATAALTGGREAEQYVDIDGVRVLREPTAAVVGSGTNDALNGGHAPALPPAGTVSTRHDRGETIVEMGTVRLVVVRVLTRRDSRSPGSSGLADAGERAAPSAVLTGTWTNQPDPQTLVQVLVQAH